MSISRAGDGLLELYRLNAAECIEIAQDVKEPIQKAALVNIAKSWMGLAQYAEWLDKQAAASTRVQAAQQPHAEWHQKPNSKWLDQQVATSRPLQAARQKPKAVT